MITRYNRGKTVRRFQIGDIVTVKIPSKDLLRKSVPGRLFALITDMKWSKYQLQTKADILNNYLPAKELGAVNQDLLNIYASEITAANKTTKISLRQAARDGLTGPVLIRCGCKKLPCGKHCKCVRNNVKCSRFCHGNNSDPACCSNNAAGVGFNQRQLLDVTLDLDHQQQQEEEGEEEEKGEEEEEEEEEE
jgi:hypothetical protein